MNATRQSMELSKADTEILVRAVGKSLAEYHLRQIQLYWGFCIDTLFERRDPSPEEQTAIDYMREHCTPRKRRIRAVVRDVVRKRKLREQRKRRKSK